MISIYLDKQYKYILRYFFLNKNIAIDSSNFFIRNISYIKFKNQFQIYCDDKNIIFKLMD